MDNFYYYTGATVVFLVIFFGAIFLIIYFFYLIIWVSQLRTDWKRFCAYRKRLDDNFKKDIERRRAYRRRRQTGETFEMIDQRIVNKEV